MTTQPSPLRKESVRPATRRQQAKAKPRRPVAGPLKAVVSPRNLSQALDRALSPQRCRESATQSGYDAQAQKLPFVPDLRALSLRQILGGSRHDLQHGMAQDPVYEGHGARLEIAGPGLSKANAQRPSEPFWEVLAEVMAAVDALPMAVRIGRKEPLGAPTPKQLRESGSLLNRTEIFAATVLELPPQISTWARTSQKQERAGIKVQLRLRAGDGGMDRVRVTGAKGKENPYFGALLDWESAAAGQIYLFDTGYCQLVSYEQIRARGCEVVTIRPEGLTVEVLEERAVLTPVPAQGYTIQSDQLVALGTGKTRSQ